jgi:antitoxin component YwqK of YwqJK toxin-antitoxin module
MSHRTLVSLLLGILFCCTANAQRQLRNGRYHEKYSDMVVTGTVVNHKFHGTFVTKQLVHHPEKLKPVWVITRIRTYTNGVQNGIEIQFDSRGDTTHIGNYCNGQPCGHWRRKWNGRLVSLCNYDYEGKEIGWQGYYNDAGILISKDYYSGDKEYYSWKYSANGVLLSRGEYSKHGKEGTWYEYSGVYSDDPRDTLPVKISHWERGVAIGWEQTFVKGVIVEVRQLMNGQLYGTHRRYRGGKLYTEQTIYDGRVVGPVATYCAAGTPFEIQNYKDGMAHGDFLYYDTVTNTLVQRVRYERQVKLSTEQWTKTGQLIFKEELISDDSSHYLFTEYHENGARKTEGAYVNGMQYGRYQTWYSNGQREISTWYRNGSTSQYLNIWNEKGVLVYTATVHSGTACDDETVRDDSGTRLTRGTKQYEEQVSKYTLPGFVSFGENGYRLPVVTISKKYPYGNSRKKEPKKSPVEQLCPSSAAPQFPGGEAARVAFLQDNIRYPQVELEAGVQGTTFIEFTVKADSTIADVKTVKPVTGGTYCSKEAERVIKMMPKWIPAKKNGKAVDQKCVIEVKFEIL